MKYLIVLVVLLVAVWIWRRSRAEQAREEAEERAQEQAKARARQAPPKVLAPAEMVSCAHCGLHLPAADALTGPDGHFCSAEHQRQHRP